MVAGSFMGGGAILLGVLIGAGNYLKWPNWTNYLWAALALVWGIASFVL